MFCICVQLGVIGILEAMTDGEDNGTGNLMKVFIGVELNSKNETRS